MAVFDISILVCLAGVDGLRFQAIVSQQGAVTLLEQIPVAKVIHRGGELIGAVDLGNPSQFPEGVLQPLAEALETFGETDRARFPVGVGQDEVIDHVIKRLAGQRDSQTVHMSEVGGAELAGRMDLIEEDLLGRPRDGLPRLDLPLQGAELAVLKPARESALKILEKGFGLEPGIAFQQVFEFWQTSWNGYSRVCQVLGVNDSLGRRSGLSVHSSGLGIHTCPQGCKIEWLTFAEELAKPANLGDFDHGGLSLDKEETA